MPRKSDALTVTVFQSPLGWFAMVGSGRVLRHITFGHPSAAAAAAAVDPVLARHAQPGEWNPPLVRRLVAYTAGERVDFRDVSIDPGPMTAFRREVIRLCRGIPYGETLTYGQLAARAGSPAAARAVGQCMASNCIPLVIPCHRVVAAGGGLGGYSTAGGVRLKQCLLDLESGTQA